MKIQIPSVPELTGPTKHPVKLFDNNGNLIVIPPAIPIGRTVPGFPNLPFFPGDYYFNQPIDELPADQQSAAKIASLGVGRLGTSPEFALNLRDNTTPIPAFNWDNVNGESDSGSYPVDANSIVSGWEFGTVGVLSAGVFLNPDWDAHILTINTDKGFLYEIYGLQNATPPYHVSTGSIWDLNGYALRTAQKIITWGADSDGLDSTDAAGMPIAPLVLTHAEFVSGQPISHALRFCLTPAQVTPGWQWPATHAAGGGATSNILMGTLFRLPADFDIASFPASCQPVLQCIKTYGVHLTDLSGTAGLISLDSNQTSPDLNGIRQGWGNGSDPASDQATLATVLHEIPLSALEIADNQCRIISVTSGQVKTNFVPY